MQHNAADPRRARRRSARGHATGGRSSRAAHRAAAPAQDDEDAAAAQDDGVVAPAAQLVGSSGATPAAPDDGDATTDDSDATRKTETPADAERGAASASSSTTLLENGSPEKWPDKESPTALFVLDEGLEKRPEMYGSLYGEKATVRIVGADSDGALRGACLCDGTEVKASGATTAVLKVGEAAFSPSAPKKAVEGSAGDPWPPTNEPPLSGTVCRADFWRDETCLVEPSLKCPLCQFMEDSPCAAVFKVWRDVFWTRSKRRTRRQDKEKKEADFAVAQCGADAGSESLRREVPRLRGDVRGWRGAGYYERARAGALIRLRTASRRWRDAALSAWAHAVDARGDVF